MEIKIIETLPQSFLQANIKEICFIVMGVDLSKSKEISLSFMDTGGFEFTNFLLQKQETKNYTGISIRDEKDLIELLDSFLSNKNKHLAQVFPNLSEGFSFFPRQYMKPITAYPNVKLNENKTTVSSWTAIYKIEIPAYNKQINNVVEYISVLNCGLEIVVSPNGEIISMKYSLLPFKTIKKEPLLQVIYDGDGVPPIIYLLNAEIQAIVPFYLAVTEELYIPATKESFLPSALFQKISPENYTSFDKDRVVTWHKRVGFNQTYFYEAYTRGGLSGGGGGVELPVGAKLIRLKPNNSSDSTTPCLCWWNGRYHLISVPEKKLGTDNVIISDVAGLVLQNDTKHLLSRIYEYYDAQKDEFNPVIDMIEKFSKRILSKEQIENGLVAINTSLKINLKDRPATISAFEKSIYKVYNPKTTNGVPFSEETLILPLSLDWFKSDELVLFKRFESVWLKNPLLGDRFVGESGESVYDDNELTAMKNEILELKEIVKVSTLKDSPEAKWLERQSPESLSPIKIIICISNNTWLFNQYRRYAESIAIENSLGPFRIPPLLSVIIHEFRISASSFLNFAKGETPEEVWTDTHIDKGYTERTWNRVNKEGLGVIEQNQNFVDHLYQAHRAYKSIALAIIISKIQSL